MIGSLINWVKSAILDSSARSSPRTPLPDGSAPRRRFRVPYYTSVGKRFVGIALLVSIAAFNTGNNPLYLLFGMMLSLIGISSILPELMLTQIRVHRHLPTRIFARQPTRITLSLENQKQRIPCFSIVVWDQVRDLTLPQWPFVFFLRVAPHSTQQATYDYIFPQRGVWRLDGFLVGSSFPFELFQKRIGLEAPTDVIVYPNPIPPQTLSFIGAIPSGTQPRPVAGQDGDFFGLRDHQPFESLRRIHWKSSAKRDQLLVRELERQDADALTICFYNHWRPSGAAEPFQPQDPDTHRQHLERSVEVCAGLVQYLLQRGHPIALVTLDRRTTFGATTQHYDLILTALARVVFHGDPEQPDPELAPPQFKLNPQDRCIVVAHGSQTPQVGSARTVARIPVPA